MTLKQDVDLLAADAALMHDIIHGGTSDTVTTDGGTVPSVAKAINDAVNAIESGQVADGTASAPSIAFTNDTNTGIYRIGADNIGISTGGTKRVDVSSTGVAVTGALSATQDIATDRSVRFPTSYLGSASDYYVSRYLTNLVYNTPSGSGHNWAVANGDKMALTTSLLTTATGVNVSVLDTTDATSTTAASLKTAGGLAVAKKGYFGDNIVMASGKGIDFSATSDGSGTTTSEVLSDYEEGSFTPVVSGDGTAGAGTYTTQVGRYTKIGNRVFFSINLNWTAHTGTGNLKITGLPFTSANVSGLAHAVTVTGISNLALSASNILTPYIGQNESTIWLNQSPIGAGGSVTQVPMDTSAQVGLSGSYSV